MTTLESKIKQFKDDFTKTTKKIIKKQLTTNEVKLNQYKNELVEIFNEYSNYARVVWNKIDNDQKLLVRTQFIYFRDRTLIALGFLKCYLEVPKEIGQLIEIIIEQSESEEEIKDQLDDTARQEEEKTKENTNMPMSAAEFVKLAIGLVPNYDGSPDGLQKFIDSVDLLTTLAEGHEDRILPFLKTRLDQKARNVLPVNLTTVNQLKEALKQNIKPVDSEVIRARIAALKIDRMPINEFSTKAEQLADEFQHALILETGNSESARKQTQKELVKLCRANARTDLTRSVVASATYNSPKEVLAKFITEIADEKTEKSVLFVRKSKGRGRGRYGNGERKYNNYSERGHGFNRRPHFERGSYRGRGRGFYRGNDSNRNNTGTSRQIRYVNTGESENWDNPQAHGLGAEAT